MSTAPEPDPVATVEVSALQELSQSEVESKAELPSCGVCNEEQIFGNVALVRLAFDSKALCLDCWRRLRDAVVMIDQVIQVPTKP